MILSTTLINDVKQDFEGGNSLSVDWDTMIRRGVENVLDNVRPETLKRRVPIYGGLASDIYYYMCPSDVLVPSSIYTNDGERQFTYTAPKAFHEGGKLNVFTIEYLNGVRFLLIRHNVIESAITIDDMDLVGSKTGAGVAVNSHNYLSGSASIAGTFTDAGEELGDTLATAVSISDYLNGVAILPAYFSSVDKLASIEIRLKTDDSNYYKFNSTTDSVGSSLIDGWNQIKFDLQNLTAVGSPDATDITKWSIIATAKTGQTITILFDKFTVQKFAPYYFEYYSTNCYIDGTTGEKWKATVSNSNNDIINFNRDVEGILHFEICLLVVQSSTFENVNSQARLSFEGQLKRKYQAYWEVHPSTEAPVSYNIASDIPLSQDIDNGVVQDNNRFL